MQIYNLPRNVKGEGRILFIFTPRSIIYTACFAVVGILLYLVFKSVGLTYVGYGCLAFFALVGFMIGTAKMPGIVGISWAKKNAGERVDDILKRTIDFKRKGNKIYIYDDKGGKTEDE